KEVSKKSPYDKDYKFFFLTTTNSSKVSWTINCKLNHLFEYSKYTKKKIGHFCEDLVAEAAVELGFPEVEVRRRLGMREIDVWCKDRNENFYWVIESKNRRQEINTTDIRHVFQKAEKATSKWNVTTKPALVSSSIYNRVPNVPNLPIIRTGAIYAQDEEFFYEYKALLGSWYIEPVDSVPDRIVEQLDEQLK
ncbi:MAG: hypothetical protein OEX77_10820, partial [Candidatus Bathyarchaeota archaeon]|nr:hypothetical protein [Candidatus Bathyarchaeota archaeon]